MLLIKDILFVPGLAKNLLSVAQIINIGDTSVMFTCDQYIITTVSPASNKELILHINKDDNLFSLRTSVEPSNSNYIAISLSKYELETIRWHYHLDHLNIRSLSTIYNHAMVVGLPPKFNSFM